MTDKRFVCPKCMMSFRAPEGTKPKSCPFCGYGAKPPVLQAEPAPTKPATPAKPPPAAKPAPPKKPATFVRAASPRPAASPAPARPSVPAPAPDVSDEEEPDEPDEPPADEEDAEPKGTGKLPGFLERMVKKREKAAATDTSAVPECPRCGSADFRPAPRRTLRIEEAKGGTTSGVRRLLGGAEGTGKIWVCRACGNRERL